MASGSPPLGAGTQAVWKRIAKHIMRSLGRSDDMSLPNYISGETAYAKFYALANKEFPTGGVDPDNIEHSHMQYYKDCLPDIEAAMGALEPAPRPPAASKKDKNVAPKRGGGGGYGATMPRSAEVRM